MKNSLIQKTLILLLSILLLRHQEFYGIDYSDEKFDTIIDRKLALLKYAKKAKESTGKKRKKYLIKYFKAYPSDFETWVKIHFGKVYNRAGNEIFVGLFYRNVYYTLINDCKSSSKDSDLITMKLGYHINPWSAFQPSIQYVKSMDQIPTEPISKKFKQVYDDLRTYYEAYGYNYNDEDFECIYDPKSGEMIGVHDYNENCEVSLMIRNELPRIIPLEILLQKTISLAIGKNTNPYFIQVNYIKDAMAFTFEFPTDVNLLEVGEKKETFKKFASILDTRTDDEIASFYYGLYFDCECSCDQYKLNQRYKFEYKKMQEINPRIAHQIKRVYKKLYAQDLKWNDGDICS